MTAPSTSFLAGSYVLAERACAAGSFADSIVKHGVIIYERD